MGRVVLDDDERVCRWLDRQMGFSGETVVKTAIGYERSGELVAAVVFDNLTDSNVFAHIASRAKMFPAALLVAVANFVFRQLDLDRMTFLVRADNERCLSFVAKLGAALEGRMRRGTKAADTLLFALWRTDPMVTRLLAHRGADA